MIFGRNCEIWSKLKYLVKIVKFGQNCETWLKLHFYTLWAHSEISHKSLTFAITVKHFQSLILKLKQKRWIWTHTMTSPRISDFTKTLQMSSSSQVKTGKPITRKLQNLSDWWLANKFWLSQLSTEGSLLPLWKFRYSEGSEEDEEGDGAGKKEPLEITSLRYHFWANPLWLECWSIIN